MFLVIFAPLKKMVVVAQLVRASDCDSEGRGFEPPRLPIKTYTGGGFYDFVRRFKLNRQLKNKIYEPATRLYCLRSKYPSHKLEHKKSK